VVSLNKSVTGLLAAAVALALLSPLASGAPDGLERVAEDLGFAGRALAGLAAPPLDPPRAQ